MNSQPVVIDTNLVFSALIPKESKIREILFIPTLTFYAPNYLITEIYLHKERITKNSKLDDETFYFLFSAIMERISFLPIEIISLESRQKGYDFCKDIDLKDTPFVSLAIELQAMFWTGDKKLKKGLTEKGFKSFFEPDDFLK